jgi:hypothetical protein
MEPLSVNNLIETDNTILDKILQYLDFDSLKAFSQAINASLRAALDESFDLHRKLNPWTHNYKKVKQPPLKLYWGFQPFDINRSNKIYGRCICKYCIDVICCMQCWYSKCVCRYSKAMCIYCLQYCTNID